MDLKEYQSKSIRTNKWRGDNPMIADAIANKTYIPQEHAYMVAIDKDTEHMLIGMCSELEELEDAIFKNDQVNIEEEVADIMWYASNEASMNRIPIVLQTDVHNYQYVHMTRAVSKYTGTVKRINIYNKAGFEKERAERLQHLVNVCFNFSSYQGFGAKIDLLHALDRNIAKLVKRYGHFYTDEAANNRDLAGERAILEGKSE